MELKREEKKILVWWEEYNLSTFVLEQYEQGNIEELKKEIFSLERQYHSNYKTRRNISWIKILINNILNTDFKIAINS